MLSCRHLCERDKNTPATETIHPIIKPASQGLGVVYIVDRVMPVGTAVAVTTVTTATTVEAIDIISGIKPLIHSRRWLKPEPHGSVYFLV